MDNKKTYKDPVYKSIFKTVSWRIIASATTALLVYTVTRKPAVSLGVAGVEVVLKMVLYFFHERIWEKFSPKEPAVE